MNCPVCNRPRPLNLWITGIWYDPLTDAPTAIAYKCVCGNNRDIAWGTSSEPERAQARLAELSRDAASEMMVR